MKKRLRLLLLPAALAVVLVCAGQRDAQAAGWGVSVNYGYPSYGYRVPYRAYSPVPYYGRYRSLYAPPVHRGFHHHHLYRRPYCGYPY